MAAPSFHRPRRASANPFKSPGCSSVMKWIKYFQLGIGTFVGWRMLQHRICSRNESNTFLKVTDVFGCEIGARGDKRNTKNPTERDHFGSFSGCLMPTSRSTLSHSIQNLKFWGISFHFITLTLPLTLMNPRTPARAMAAEKPGHMAGHHHIDCSRPANNLPKTSPGKS
jgi:hypothetical protein